LPEVTGPAIMVVAGAGFLHYNAWCEKNAEAEV